MKRARARIFRIALALMVGAAAIFALSGPYRPPSGISSAPIAPRSLAYLAAGQGALDAERLDDAIDAFESALVADPRNAAAHVGLARAAMARSLPGKALTHTRRAREIAADDRAALAVEAEAYVARGAFGRARANLARLLTLCDGDACPEALIVQAAIHRAGERTVMRREEVLPQPVVEPLSPPNR